MVFSSKKKKSNPKDSPTIPTIAPQSAPRASVSSNRQHQGSDIEDLIANQPATYSRSGSEPAMGIQGCSKAMENPTVEGKAPRKLPNQ
jgi:hypothetical protein